MREVGAQYLVLEQQLCVQSDRELMDSEFESYGMRTICEAYMKYHGIHSFDWEG